MTYSGFTYSGHLSVPTGCILLLSGSSLAWRLASALMDPVYLIRCWRKTVQDELTLLHRARAMDPDALAEIHDTYYIPIYRYIVLRVNDHQTAEDLTSEVFTRLLHALQDKTAPANTIRGWLFAVASRIVKDHYRKHYRHEKANMDDLVPNEPATPDQILESKISQETLLEAVTDLTEEQQEVIALRFGYGLPIQEVADAVGKSIGSVKMLQARAISALSKKLTGEEARS